MSESHPLWRVIESQSAEIIRLEAELAKEQETRKTAEEGMRKMRQALRQRGADDEGRAG